MSPTHIMWGCAAWMAECAAVPHPAPRPVILGAGVAALASIAPDIDTRRSWAATSLPPFTTVASWVIRKTGGGHRGVTHHPLGLALFTAACVIPLGFWPIPWYYPVAAVTGYLSHLLLDQATTILGIRSGERKRSRRSTRHRPFRWQYRAEYWAVQPLAAATITWAGFITAGRFTP